MNSKRLVIIDGYALLYRAFFATRYLSTSDGRPTNALFGFTQMLFHILENVKPDAIVVALDAPGKTFRHAEYSEYKGTRRETQPELKSQFPITRDLLTSLGIPQVEVTGFEADDVVGTISRLAEENGYDTIIVTGDLDALQLVDACVSVMTPRTGVTETVTYTPDAVRGRYGFGPEFIADFKALKGDTSDNIPGVPGIGDKGGAELIAEFGTIEEMLARFDEIPPKYAKKMEPVKEQMVKSKWLATIKRDVPLEYDFRPFVLNQNQIAAAHVMLESLEMKALAKRCLSVLGKYSEGREHPKEINPFHAAAMVEENEVIEVKLEVVSSYPELLSFVGENNFAALWVAAPPANLLDQPEPISYIAVGRRVARAPAAVASQLLAEHPNRAILHDSKKLFKGIGMTPATPYFDAMLAGYVLQSGRSSYTLADLVQGYLDVAPPTLAEQMAAALYELESVLRARLEKEAQTHVFANIELPLVPILAAMETLGIKVQREGLQEFSKTLETAIESTTLKIYELAGETFNIGSPKQLGEVLFEKMMLPGAQKTKTGYATGAEILQLVPHEIAREIQSWRELSKLKSTYADSLEKLIQADGRIHTTYNQTVAATGRISSNDPNLQNIPIRTELGRGIRRAFVADGGYSLLSLDYSQIELRILAHMCGEPALVQAFTDRIDVHTVTAQHMFGLGSEPASKEQRRYAKMLNYAVLYGVTDFGLANQLGGGFSRSEAKELITVYNERFPSVKDFTRLMVAEAKAKGFTTTMTGRRRYFPDIHAAKMQERQYAERQAMNAPLQGSAADMIKLAMIDVNKLLKMRQSRMLLNVHDELVFEITEADRDLIEPIRIAMETALPLNVPVEVDAKIGPNWNEMTPILRAGD